MRVHGRSIPHSLLPESFDRNRVSGDGWAAVGDAAGLVDPLTGEGIYYALRSADLLGACVREGRLADYARRVDQYAEGFRDMRRVVDESICENGWNSRSSRSAGGPFSNTVRRSGTALAPSAFTA